MSFIDAVVYQQTHLGKPEKPSDAAITHSVLDCVPELLASRIPLLELRHLRLRAARLFLTLITPSGLRLAVKTAQARNKSSYLPFYTRIKALSEYPTDTLILSVAMRTERCPCIQGYKLHEKDLWEVRHPGRPFGAEGTKQIQTELARSIQPFVSSSKTLTPAVLLLMHFRDVGLLHFNPQKLMGQLVAKGQARLAEEWAQDLGHAFQVIYSDPGLQSPVHCHHHSSLLHIANLRVLHVAQAFVVQDLRADLSPRVGTAGQACGGVHSSGQSGPGVQDNAVSWPPEGVPHRGKGPPGARA